MESLFNSQKKFRLRLKNSWAGISWMGHGRNSRSLTTLSMAICRYPMWRPLTSGWPCAYSLFLLPCWNMLLLISSLVSIRNLWDFEEGRGASAWWVPLGRGLVSFSLGLLPPYSCSHNPCPNWGQLGAPKIIPRLVTVELSALTSWILIPYLSFGTLIPVR